MSKNDKSIIALLALVALGAVAIAVIDWLESIPSCDKGCRTQLEHVKDHILKDLLRAAVPQLRPFLG